MAVYTVQGSGNIPENAIKLSRDEVLDHQESTVRDWSNGSEVGLLRYGTHIASAVVGVSAFMVVKHFRTFFNLGKKAQFVTYFPPVAIGMYTTTILHNKFVREDVLIMKMGCPLCQVVKSAAIQLCCGFFYPCLLGGMCSSSLSSIFQTSKFQRNAKDCAVAAYKAFKQGGFTFQLLIAANILTAVSVPYMQSKELQNVMSKLHQLESLDEDFS